MKYNFLYLLILFIGCGPLDGFVVDKCIVPEHNETHWITVGSVGKNSMPISIPINTKIETEYFIEVKEKDGFQTKIKLSKEDYESYNINDQYPHREKP